MNRKIKNPFANMQRVSVIMLSIICSLFFAIYSCKKQLNFDNENNSKASAFTRSETDDIFYYYFSEKIYLQQVKNKVFIKFTS